MSVEALIRRAKRLIAEKEKRCKIASIFESYNGEFPESHAGLVIIYSQEPYLGTATA